MTAQKHDYDLVLWDNAKNKPYFQKKIYEYEIYYIDQLFSREWNQDSVLFLSLVIVLKQEHFRSFLVFFFLYLFSK